MPEGACVFQPSGNICPARCPIKCLLPSAWSPVPNVRSDDSPGPLPPATVRLLSTGHPDRLSASWGPAAGGRDGYALTLYHARLGTVAATASLGSDTHNFTFTGLAPGSKYLLEVVSVAGSYQTPAGNISNWTCEYPDLRVMHALLGSHEGSCKRHGPTDLHGRPRALPEPKRTLVPWHRAGVCPPSPPAPSAWVRQSQLQGPCFRGEAWRREQRVGAFTFPSPPAGWVLPPHPSLVSGSSWDRAVSAQAPPEACRSRF